MKLFHGTSSRFLDAILRDGICPREITKGDGNWKTFKSLSGHVYLTSTYPFYFAVSCTDIEDSMIVLEIDADKLDNKNFYPDEDLVGFAICKGMNCELETAQLIAKRDIEKFRGLWKRALKELGNISYKGIIPVQSILRYVVFEWKKRPELTKVALDPTISTINFMLKGKFYRELTAWFFGDIETLPMVQERQEQLDMGFNIPYVIKGLEFWKKQSQDRTGIEVVVRGKNGLES